MKQLSKRTQTRLIRFTFEKKFKDGLIKREIVMTGYHGLVIVILSILAIGTALILSGNFLKKSAPQRDELLSTGVIPIVTS